MELTIVDYDMVHMRPSEIAAAALCLSIALLGGAEWVSSHGIQQAVNVSHLTLQVTKKNPLWHTVPIKIITSLILVIKI